MESGYYSEMENVDSASGHVSDSAADPQGQGGLQRSRGGRSRSGGSGGRRKREFISDEKKDDSYWEKRRKNNEAAKRSREKRRISDLVLENQVLALNQENVNLKSELLALKLRFGLITTAAYSEKSRQLAGEAVSSIYTTAYSTGPTMLLQSDSSEAEHSSRSSGFTPISKYSPRGSLSDVSNTSLSAGNSPEHTVQADTKRDNSMDRDRDRDPFIKEVMNVQVVFDASEPTSFVRGGYDEIGFVSYKESAKYNHSTRDIIQFGCLEGTGPYSARRGDYRVPSGHGEHGMDSPLRAGRTLPTDPLLAPSQRYYPTEAPVPEKPAAQLGYLHHAQNTAGELVKRFEVQNPDDVPPPHFSIGKQEVPSSVIEAPPGLDQGMVPPVNVPACTLSEGSDSDSQERGNRHGRVIGTHSDPSQARKRTALPHKLRLKVRAIQGSGQETKQDHPPSGHRDHSSAPLQRQFSFHRSGCIVKSCIPACGKGDLWSETGLLAATAGRQWQGGLPRQFEEDPSKGSTNLPRSVDSVAGYKALEGNAMESTEECPLHAERNSATRSTEGQLM
ncbi:nuclear factor interleukin-3-regulated protein-like [Amblyraja radiata]|uniref:nuclear factor interleukin-3-regulated protein-like n=1 Tax=Amblyraja radiata TaxID=386614 RepID=UPI00140216EB|nr:nuclear factor interleukin-3-regulated protein-like [Amblyraja radiata]